MSWRHYSYVILIIGLLFQELQALVQLEAKEHEVFVDSIVINFVPMQVGDVEEGLKPLLLSLYSVKFTDLGQELGNLLSELTLVLGLVRVPVIYTAECKRCKVSSPKNRPSQIMRKFLTASSCGSSCWPSTHLPSVIICCVSDCKPSSLTFYSITR